ncbi:HK97 gp10 family phage protein [Bacilliculturomica massiliensis]|uniref:HK97 gp10 family phage protein n=1 Tax=Bacilliculturomica massiliensis TaxID=1917867 RepID=UPI00103214A7|nr:HK97 gp10 family phage protein [Bacilliculturomica massiliensis]
MATGIRVDVRQLQRLNSKLKQFADSGVEQLCEECAKELAARLLRKVTKRTPVGQYNKPVNFKTADGRTVSFTPRSAKTGGTLRRGWTAATHAEAASGSGNGKNAKDYVSSSRIYRTGGLYCIRVSNPVQYAPYVEYGHRTANHNGWVPGRFMLTMSVQELQGQAQGIVEKKLMRFLGGVFNGSGQ